MYHYRFGIFEKVLVMHLDDCVNNKAEMKWRRCAYHSCWKSANHKAAQCLLVWRICSRPHLLRKISIVQAKRGVPYQKWLYRGTGDYCHYNFSLNSSNGIISPSDLFKGCHFDFGHRFLRLDSDRPLKHQCITGGYIQLLNLGMNAERKTALVSSFITGCSSDAFLGSIQ